MKKLLRKFHPFIIFLSIEIILYIVFLSVDFGTKVGDSSFIKYSSIILCALFSIYKLKELNTKDLPYIIGNFLTLISDLFLLVLNDHYEIGVIFFILVQTAYFIYQNMKNHCRYFLPTFLGYTALSLAIIILLPILNMFTLLNLLVALYFPLLITNFVLSLIITIKEFQISNLLLTIGLFLFIGCDICVGLSNINVGTFTYETYYFVSCLSWVFYLPSQVIMQLGFQFYKNAGDQDD